MIGTELPNQKTQMANIKATSSMTVIMYHYVRDLPNTRYPRIKGRTTASFIAQLDYIERNYTVISWGQCLESYLNETQLPPRSVLLTFDDGFIDHYTVVFPILYQRALPGLFFPPAQAILERKLLDVHKIHLILASITECVRVRQLVSELLECFRATHELPLDETLYAECATGSRFDSPDICVIKRLLQTRLPAHIRTSILNQLFPMLVAEDEAVIGNEYYMTLGQLQLMAQNGMAIGGHGFNHTRLATLPEEAQRQEILLTVKFLEQIYGHTPQHWAMAYPYGDWSTTLHRLLVSHGCAVGFTADPRIADVDPTSRFCVPRLDTNDIP